MGLRRGRGEGEKGQVAILFALVFTFMFVLFAFVVDFGHLINAKINLQIAADSAAYAGAAWQARQMNRIAALNYRMRQDIKEMVLRAQVTHLRHNLNFPRGSSFYEAGNSVPRGLTPLICQQAGGYRSISGVTYQNTTNLCKNADPTTGGLPPVVVPPLIASFDPFAAAIVAQIRQIQVETDKECRAAARDNEVLAQHLVALYQRRSQSHLRQINEMENWLNSVANESPTNSRHPIMRVALETARRNLSLANQDDFRFEVLQPRGGRYLQLDPVELNASMFYVNYQVAGSGCIGIAEKLDFEDVFAGVQKEQSLITYFAVKLTSRPRMMFMPARWVEAGFPQLEALAVAKPFGSRIGPDNAADPLLPVPGRPGNANRILNFSFRPLDNMGMLNTKMLAYFDALHPFNSANRPDGNQQTGWPDAGKTNADLRIALQAIRAPTIFDALFYTVFPDPDRAGDNLDLFPEALYPDYLEAAGPDNNLINTRNPATEPYLPQAVGSRNRGPGWVQINAEETGLGGPYSGYGEEALSSHSTALASSLPIVSGKENEFGFATREQVHSGWRPQGDTGRPRIGYSVKLISFDALTRALRVRSGASGQLGPVANPPTGDPNTERIIH